VNAFAPVLPTSVRKIVFDLIGFNLGCFSKTAIDRYLRYFGGNPETSTGLQKLCFSWLRALDAQDEDGFGSAVDYSQQSFKNPKRPVAPPVSHGRQRLATRETALLTNDKTKNGHDWFLDNIFQKVPLFQGSGWLVCSFSWEQRGECRDGMALLEIPDVVGGSL
jgi:hypothetical protein